MQKGNFHDEQGIFRDGKGNFHCVSHKRDDGGYKTCHGKSCFYRGFKEFPLGRPPDPVKWEDAVEVSAENLARPLQLPTDGTMQCGAVQRGPPGFFQSYLQKISWCRIVFRRASNGFFWSLNQQAKSKQKKNTNRRKTMTTQYKVSYGFASAPDTAIADITVKGS